MGKVIAFTVVESLGYCYIATSFTSIRMCLESYQVPKAFKELPIVLIASGLMSFAFLGLVGVVYLKSKINDKKTTESNLLSVVFI